MISKIKNCLVIVLFILAIIPNTLKAQTIRTVGSTGADYSTLKLAFDAVNSGLITGDIEFQVNSNTTETASAILNASGIGSANYSSITIYPTAEGLSITGNIAAPLIDLNGADNVTIDGRVNAMGSTKSMTIVNTNTSNVTIQFINDACSNTLKYLVIKGSNNNISGSYFIAGVVSFLGTNQVTGNDNNTIESCDFSAAGTNRPRTVIWSYGTSGKTNDNIVINNCNFYDHLNKNTNSSGALNSEAIAWGLNTGSATITNNSFYETTPFAGTGSGGNISIININSTGNLNISNNFIGGTSEKCGGSTLVKTGNNQLFYGINASGANLIVENNIITNISWTNNGNAHFYGIRLGTASGVGEVTNNKVGSEIGNDSIIFVGGATGAIFFGITTNGRFILRKNIVGAIKTDNLSSFATNFYGMSRSSGGRADYYDNIIGSKITANSIELASLSTGNPQMAIGIDISNSGGTATYEIDNNIIANITNRNNSSSTSLEGFVKGISVTSNAPGTITNNEIYNLSIQNANTSTTHNASLGGIVINFTERYNVKNNNIYQLSNSNSTFAGTIHGIYFSGITTGAFNTCSENFIHSLLASGDNSNAIIIGILANSGTTSYSNNIVSIGSNSANSYIGFFDRGNTSQTCNFYHNTLQINGTHTFGSNKSVAFWSNGNNNTRNFRNNIFNNSRTNDFTASGKHYSAYYNYSTTGSLINNYNNYFSNGLGGVLAFYNGLDILTMAEFRTDMGQDANSRVLNPIFFNNNGILPEDYIPSNSKLIGVSGTGIITDYHGLSRATIPTMGAFDISLSFVEVWKSGIFQKEYLTLKEAFDAINEGIHTGILDIKITESTTETASATLYQSGYNSTSDYTSINIYPTSTEISISGTLTAPLIDLNGAHNVTIDGRVNAEGNTTSLEIVNLSTASSATTSTIRFINDASNNTVKYSILKGSSNSSSAGIVFFSTAINTGNNNNVIELCNMTHAGSVATSRPVNAISSSGTASYENRSNIIRNNNIYNILRQATNSTMLLLGANSLEWQITDNSFYETSTFTPTSSATYNIINIIMASSGGHFVSGNFIGGQLPECGGGSWTKNGNNNIFYGIYINGSTSNPTIVRNNTISNFNWTNNTGNALWTAIHVQAGVATIGEENNGNLIGAATGTGSILVTNGTTGGTVTAITIASTSNVICQHNTIGSITTANETTLATNFIGINKTAAGTVNINNNTIGSTTTANSINASSSSTANAQTVYGILSSGTATTANAITISNNIIANLNNATTNATTSTTGLINGIATTGGTNTITNNTIRNLSIANANNTSTHTASIGGIVMSGVASSTINTVAENTLHSLSNDFPNFAGNIHGIYFTGNASTANVCSRNLIHSLSASNSHSTFISGIRAQSGQTTYSNNIVNIGDNSGNTFYGFIDVGTASQHCNLYHNTIYISGQPTSGTNNSAALWSQASSNTRNYRNNIFYNARSNDGASGSHYAAFYNYATTSNLTNNNNNYYAPGIGGVMGYHNTTTLIDLAALQSSIGQDLISRSVNPNFANAGSLIATDYIPNYNKLIGALGTGITTDYSGATRATVPTMGAYENLTQLELPIQVWKAGEMEATYGNLKLAFDKINDGTHTGILEIRITESVGESVSAVLYQSGYNLTSDYTSIHIYPTKENVVVGGNIANSPLIDLNGADNVTIDGRVNGVGTVRSLSFENPSATAASVIRFINGAENNNIKHLVLKGASTSTSTATIFFSGTNQNTGNSNNTIDSCLITGFTNIIRPKMSVYSAGSLSHPNSDNTIKNNHFKNFLNPNTQTGSSFGIALTSGTSRLIIRDNHFFETEEFVATNADNSFIIISSNAADNADFSISNNYIGGSEPYCQGGIWTKNSRNNAFTGIHLSVSATAPNIIVENNHIENMSWTNTGNAAWIGINIQAGAVKVGMEGKGNVIGGETGVGSIVVTNGTTGGTITGIRVASTSAVICQYNTIGSITTNNSSNDFATNFIGIHKTASSGNIEISNNIIGSLTTANSINALSPSNSNAQTVYGILNEGNGSSNINNTNYNIVANLTNSTTNSNTATLGLIRGISCIPAGVVRIVGNTIRDLNIFNANTNNALSASSVGLFVNTTSAGITILDNTIYNIYNSFDNYSGEVIGFLFKGNSGSSTVSRNIIHSIAVASSNSVAASLYGVKIFSGAANFSNNIITLSPSSTSDVFGIANYASTSYSSINYIRLYFNTIYVGGNLTSGSNKSYALYDNTDRSRDYKNNIFQNERSTIDGTNLHYAFYHALNTNAPNVCEYNNYSVTGVGGSLGYYNSTNVSILPIVPSKDLGSISINPSFINSGGIIAADYVPTYKRLIGNTVTGITTDYAENSRSLVPTIGAFEISLDLPIEVWKIGVKQANYLTLRAAFDAINAGTHIEEFELRITDNTTETSTAKLNASGTGSANYSSILIYPTNPELSITGNMSNPLIELNGADNVIFDGRVYATGNTKSLELINTNTTASETSTIKFTNDASNNVFRYCTIKGSSISILAGIIWFSSANAAGIGNDDNIIEFCDITHAGTNVNRPIYAVFSNGTDSRQNSGNIIRNNLIYNTLRYGNEGSMVALGANSIGFIIENNSMFETTEFVTTSTLEYNGININSTSTSGGHIIRGNHIGGNAPLSSGTWTKTGNNNIFNAIRLNGNTTNTFITGNTIRNFNWSNSSNAAWNGINIVAGAASIGEENNGNVIGAATGTGSIIVANAASGGTVTAINIASTGTVACQHNTIGSIITSNGATLATNFVGINKTATAGTVNINNNTIGSTTTANSINASSASTANAQTVYGILSQGTETTADGITISNNIIANLNNATTNATTSTTGLINGIATTGGTNTITNNTIRNLSIANANNTSTHTASIGGIVMSGVASSTINTVADNAILSLSNSFTNFAGHIRGVYSTGNASTDNICTRNYTHSLSALNSHSATVTGIWANSGQTTYSNNIINIGDNTGNRFYGFYDVASASQTCNFYNNTIYLDGMPEMGSNTSSALYSALNNNTRNYRNNIFHNARSNNGANGIHYAAYLNYVANGALTINNNNYYTTGNGGVLMYKSSANRNDIEAIRASTSQDVRSKSANPLFEDVSSQTPESLKIKSTKLLGIAIAEVTHDFGMNLRATVPTMGAWDYYGDNVWVGEISEDWNNPANWAAGKLIDDGDDLIFDESPLNHCVMDRNRIVNDITNTQSEYILKINGHILSMNGQTKLQNGALIDGTRSNSTISFTGNNEQTLNASDFFENKVYNFHINNINNAIINGNLNVLGKATSTVGQFNCLINSPTLRYCGVAAQTINPSVFSNNSIWNLNIANNLNITIEDDLKIKNKLDFENGKILTSDNTITIDYGAIITGFNNTSFIDGFCSKIGNTEFLFPIGKGNKYAPVSISAPSNNDDNYTASYYPSNPAVTYSDSTEITIQDISKAEYWLIDREKGENEVSVSLTWDHLRSDIGEEFEYLKIVRWDGDLWVNAGAVDVVGTKESGVISSKPLSKFSPFSFGIKQTNFLPVELLSFKANCIDQNLTLAWQTASEINNSHFLIEQSEDGISWSKIDSVQGNGNSNQLLNYYRTYAYKDIKSYFRLIQIDFDGKKTIYSPISNPCSFDIDIIVYPNPSNDNLNIICNDDLMDTYVLYNNKGQAVIRGELRNNTIINIQHLPKGIYLLKPLYNTSKTIKIIKN